MGRGWGCCAELEAVWGKGYAGDTGEKRGVYKSVHLGHS